MNKERERLDTGNRCSSSHVACRCWSGAVLQAALLQAAAAVRSAAPAVIPAVDDVAELVALMGRLFPPPSLPPPALPPPAQPPEIVERAAMEPAPQVCGTLSPPHRANNNNKSDEVGGGGGGCGADGAGRSLGYSVELGYEIVADYFEIPTDDFDFDEF